MHPEATPLLVLINGLPGTGKTTLGQRLSRRFRWPFVSKDRFKELIFDGLGWSDKEWSLRVSATTHRIMDYVITEELNAGHSIIVESNLKPDIDAERFDRFRRRYGVQLVQLFLWARGDVLFERYRAREDSTRHPGHVESASLEEQRAAMAPGRYEPLTLVGTTIEIDTTDFSKLDDEAIFERIVQLSKSTKDPYRG